MSIKTAYWVLFQGLHEKGVPEDQSAILCHLGLLLWAEGREKESKQIRRLFKEAGQDDFVLSITERGHFLLLPVRIVFIILNLCLQF